MPKNRFYFENFVYIEPEYYYLLYVKESCKFLFEKSQKINDFKNELRTLKDSRAGLLGFLAGREQNKGSSTESASGWCAKLSCASVLAACCVE